jgi:hypothetical protein
MSSNLPPSGPAGPDGPDGHQTEYLEQGSGAPLPPAPPPARNLKPYVIGGAAVAGLAVAGGAAWAAMSFFSTGAQPAEALPGSTLAYAGVDLDPSGGQKIEAIRTLNKFPAFKDELDLDTDDDIMKRLFDEIQSQDECANLDYEDDIASWLGLRAGVAVVDAEPTVVGVVQVTDADAAAAGLDKLRNCGANGDASEPAPADAEMGFAVEGDWAIVAETDEIAERVLADGAEGSLADDSEFQTWTGRTGDPGIVTVYVAAGAADAALDHLDELFGSADDLGGIVTEPSSYDDGSTSAEGDVMVLDEEVPDDTEETMGNLLEGFDGMAATLRFSDGSIELEQAGSFGSQLQLFYATDKGADAMSTLPADTVAAFGMGFDEGWVRALAEQFQAQFGDLVGEDMTVDDMFAELSDQTGLDIPADIETLTGESAVVAVGPDFSPEQFMNSADGSDVPIGVKIKGDADGIEAVLDKLREMVGPDANIFGSEAGDGFVAISPSADYRAALLEDGGLGDSDTFKDVIREAEQAGAVFYVDFDAGDDWLVEMSGDDEDAKANLAPLSAVGGSTWTEGDVTHAVLRLTTD